MAADLPDEQAKKMSSEIIDIKEQWKILIEGFNTLKERSESMIYPTSDHLVKQNENLINYIENWLVLGRQLLCQSEQINSNTSSDNHHLLSQLKVRLNKTAKKRKKSNFVFFFISKECEEEMNRLKNLFNNITTTEVTHSLVNELTVVRVTFISFFFNLLLL